MNKLRNMYFNFNGRLNRLKYFTYGIPLGIFFKVIDEIPVDTTEGLIIFFVLFIPYMVSLCSLIIRRLHDLNITGWLTLVILLQLLPVVNILAIIFYLCILIIPGKKGPNKYGDDPLNPNQSTPLSID